MTRPGTRPLLRHRRIVDARLGVPLLALWRVLDWVLPKRSERWAFFDHPLKRGQFIENARAVYEQVRDDPRVQIRIFVRGGHRPRGIEESARVRVVALDTLAGLLELARCGVLLLTNSTALDMSLAWRDGGHGAPRPALRRRLVVNLWHGIPLKRLFALANPSQRRHGDRDRFRRRERRFYTGLVASSEVDANAMAAIFHPIPPANVWVTGLPRTDFLRMPEAELPATLRTELARVRALRRGRRLLLYAPTYRDASAAGDRDYAFSDAEVARLKHLLRRHDAVLGFRGHYVAAARAEPGLARHADGDAIVDLGHADFHEIAPLLRESSLVLTDYSSVYIDALCLDLPVIGFAHDLDDYRQRQNGLLYDLDLAFPGPVTTTFDALLDALEARLAAPRFAPDERYRNARRLFFRHDDACNARRLVERIHDTLAGTHA
ncbi:CDP-glycerol glycerophosphotransferase family protein [Stenotrophomonas acidaminiphila]|uniref:CDP-glycerol glycerophosphotransferase family protein n=1 Tax=Stenotrophomonas acidaminiphila TaxID=128780 RepID=UPI003BF0A084